MYDIETIASYFIEKANTKIIDEDGSAEGISHLKLQKILYFAQIVFLCTKNKELFQEEILAWQYGPVIESIYNEYSRKRKKWNSQLLQEDILDKDYKDKINEKDSYILDDIYNEFWKYSASELVDITHSHKPWRESFIPWESNIISKKSMVNYYKNLFSE